MGTPLELCLLKAKILQRSVLRIEMNREEDELQSPPVKSIPVGGILIFLLMAVILGGIGLYLFTDHDHPLAIGGRPQDFTLTTFNGEQLATADLRSKVVLIHF